MSARARLRVVDGGSAPRTGVPPTSGVAPRLDEDLVARCAVHHTNNDSADADAANGDTTALAELYDRHVVTVARFVGNLGHVEPADVEDVVHDVFVAIYRSAAGFRRDASVRTWILSIAANIARDRARKRRRFRLFADLFAGRERNRTAESPDMVFDARELGQQLQKALSNLPFDQATVFVLCEIEELPCSEAARIVGAPIGTVYRWLHEARRALYRVVKGGATS